MDTVFTRETRPTNGVLTKITENGEEDATLTVKDATEGTKVTKTVCSVLPTLQERRPKNFYRRDTLLMQLQSSSSSRNSSYQPKMPVFLRPVLSFIPPPSIACPEDFVPPTRSRNERRQAISIARARIQRNGYQKCIQNLNTTFGYNTWMNYRCSLFEAEDLRDAEAMERGFDFPEDDHPVSPNAELDLPTLPHEENVPVIPLEPLEGPQPDPRIQRTIAPL